MTARKKAEQWLDQLTNEADKHELANLLNGPENFFEDAFYKDLEFGTGGMRGLMGIGSNRVNRYTLGMATQGLCDYLRMSFQEERIKVAIAYDCRNNSDTFAKIVSNVFTANGIEVYLFSALRPTPQLSYAVRKLNCQSGIVITASHNPPEYNGYKVYWNDGAQIVAPHDKGIIDKVNQISSINEVKFEANDSLQHSLGREMDEAFIEDSIKQRKSKDTHPLKIVFTSLHGTAITLMPDLLNKAGYEDLHIVADQAEPDGNFPTVKSPNPEERAALKMALDLADDNGADLVVGTDPDSDRLGVAVRDDNNEMVLLNGNQCGVLITDYLLKKNQKIGNEFIAYTIVSSDLFADVATEYGCDADVCLTGFKHIASLIREGEGNRTFIGGGEESYGYMIGDFVRDKDALTSTLIFCDLAAEAKSNGTSAFNLLCDIYAKHGLYKEHLISITKKGKDGADQISAMMQEFRDDPPKTLGGMSITRIDDYQSSVSLNTISGDTKAIELPKSNVLQFYTENGSKISARPSGTEPKIKFYFSVKKEWDPAASYSEQEKILSDQIDRIIEDLNLES